MAKPTLLERIDALLAERSPRRLDDLEAALWPAEQFPRAHRYSSNGGPPGCRMTSSAALRRGNYPTERPSPCVGATLVYRRRRP